MTSSDVLLCLQLCFHSPQKCTKPKYHNTIWWWKHLRETLLEMKEELFFLFHFQEQDMDAATRATLEL